MVISRLVAFAVLFALCLSGVAAAQLSDGPTVEPSSPAHASDDDKAARARELFQQGVEAFEAQDWARARALFELSDALYVRKSNTFNLALSCFRLGELSQTLRYIDRYLAQSDATRDADARAQMLSLRDKANRMMAVLVLLVSPAIARVYVNDVATEQTGSERRLELPPGAHRIRAEAPQHEPTEIEVELQSASSQKREIALAPTPAPRAAAPPERSPVEPPALAADSAPADQAADWPLWVAVGAALAAATLTAIVVAADGDDPAEPDAVLVALTLP